MKKSIIYLFLLGIATLSACDDSEPDVEPNDDNFPFRLVLDAEEGAALPDEEDYGLEVKFADYIGELPNQQLNLNYAFTDTEGSFVNNVSISKVTYKVEDGDCEYERELPFVESTIILIVDEDLGTVPEEFEIEFALPGADDTEGGFTFEITELTSQADVLLNQAATFEYEVLENDVAGAWVLELNSGEEFEAFKSVLGAINEDLTNLSFADITGAVSLEFEFEEMKIEVELQNPEIEEVCEEGEIEEEETHLEIEGEYEAEEGELEIGGDHIITDDGVEEELEYLITASYTINGDELEITFYQIIDEDQYEEGDELFTSESGITFTFIKD
ncbi:hypothetical protein LVD15_08105 [Fulvivirga maritima]|uniref:hypothetical protein n=1 Tax=Fulvivirga maritima TaxID=2904247 RepID=UPI001F39A1A4|nr:hypothetical protein [Fulvivirga maritima]UII28379.1 hypothetical protein LVD15_08105 [Fulvivirga maritima]